MHDAFYQILGESISSCFSSTTGQRAKPEELTHSSSPASTSLSKKYTHSSPLIFFWQTVPDGQSMMYANYQQCYNFNLATIMHWYISSENPFKLLIKTESQRNIFSALVTWLLSNNTCFKLLLFSSLQVPQTSNIEIKLTVQPEIIYAKYHISICNFYSESNILRDTIYYVCTVAPRKINA